MSWMCRSGVESDFYRREGDATRASRHRESTDTSKSQIGNGGSRSRNDGAPSSTLSTRYRPYASE
jgi:hypothetical protein